MGAGIRAFFVALMAVALTFMEVARAKLDEACAWHVVSLLYVPLRCISDSKLRLHLLVIDVVRDLLPTNSCSGDRSTK